MKLFSNILIGCMMIQMTNSCSNEVTADMEDIEWSATTLPEEEDGQSHIGLAGPAVGVIGNYILIGGGANFPDKLPWEGGTKAYHEKIYIYEWETDKDLQHKKSLTLPVSIAYPGNCSSGDNWFVAGGENDNGLLQDVYSISLNPDLEINLDTLPSLPYGLTASSMTCIDDVLYVIGGERDHKTSDEILRLAIHKDQVWEVVAKLPEPLSNMVVSSVGDKIYIAGGRRKVEGQISPFSNHLFVYDTIDKTVKQLSDMPHALAAGVGIAQGDRLYVFGGDTGTTFHQVEKLILEAANEPDVQRKAEIIKKKNNVQMAHPGFSKQQLVYLIAEDKWESLPSEFPFEVPVTTTAVTIGTGEIVIPSGEVKAGVRTNNIFIGRFKYNK